LQELCKTIFQIVLLLPAKACVPTPERGFLHLLKIDKKTICVCFKQGHFTEKGE